MLLLTFLDCLCSRRWQVFEGARLPIHAPRYCFSQDCLSIRSDSRALAAGLLLTLWHRLRYFEYHQFCIPCHCQPQILAAYHSLTFCLWYPVPVVIYERHCKSSIFWAIWACKLVCLLDVTLKKNQKSWLLTCNSAWFWGICYLAKLSHLVHSFGAWFPYCGPVSEALVHGAGFASK